MCSREVFVVRDRFPTDPPTYEIEDYSRFNDVSLVVCLTPKMIRSLPVFYYA